MKRKIIAIGLIVLVLGGSGLLWSLHQSSSPRRSTTPNAPRIDKTPPTVQLTVPAGSLQAVQGSLGVTVTASDNQDVTHVVYSIDGVFAGITYVAPFSMTLDVSKLAPGTHTLSVVAYDAAGNASTLQSVQFTIVSSGGTDTGGETVTTGSSSSQTSHRTSAETSSSGGSSSSNSGGGDQGSSRPPDTSPPSAPTGVMVSDPGTFFVHISWTAATDNVGVAGYQVWRNGALLTTTTQTAYDDTTSLPGGIYEYEIVAFDAAGNTTSSTPVGIDLAAATVFNNDDTPPGDSGDPTSIEVGMRFRTTHDGEITGVRFYKSTADTGTHIGNLWTNSGTKLASVTFSNESASGWQTATFSSPVHITAATTYVVSYFAPNGHYTGSTHYFDLPHGTNSYISGLENGIDGSNGVFSTGASSSFPSQTFNAANYWVDAMFTPDTPAIFISTPACPAYPSFPQPTLVNSKNCAGAFGGENVATITGQAILGNDNQVYSNLFVDGNVVVTGCGDTLRNVTVVAGEPFTGDLSTPDLFAIWLQVPANCTTTIDRVTVVSAAAPNDYVTTGIRVANGGPVTITNTSITGVQIGVLTGPGTIQDSYIWLAPTTRDDHNEDILEDGTTGLTLNHNVLLNQNVQTSAISLFTENGPNSNILVENNLLAGGGYTVYGGDGKTSNSGPIGPPTNVSFVNNVFWKLYYPGAGALSSGRDYNPNGGGQWLNNVFMNGGGSASNAALTVDTITNDQVPQPPVAP